MHSPILRQAREALQEIGLSWSPSVDGHFGVPQVAMNRRAPIFATLRASPRWPALARLMNLPGANE